MRFEQLELSDWNGLLPDSGFGVFHTAAALRVLDEYTPGELHLYGAFKGQQPVGIVPIFLRETLNFRMALSPPPGYGVRELGPLLYPISPKRNKQEKINKKFTERLIDAVDADSATTLFRMSTGPYYRDARPFQWAGFDVYPTYTYQLDLKSAAPEEMLKSFSKSLRRDIRAGEDSDVVVRIGETDPDARNIYHSIESRYDEQEKSFLPSWEYMRDMIDALEDRACVYVAESPDSEFLSGIVALYSNDAAYFWKGGTGRSDHNFSINSLIHWRIINDIVDGEAEYDVGRYDFHTANNERIVQYKSKFNAELIPHYRIESGGLAMTAAKKAYRSIVQ